MVLDDLGGSEFCSLDDLDLVISFEVDGRGIGPDPGPVEADVVPEANGMLLDLKWEDPEDAVKAERILVDISVGPRRTDCDKVADGLLNSVSVEIRVVDRTFDSGTVSGKAETAVLVEDTGNCVDRDPARKELSSAEDGGRTSCDQDDVGTNECVFERVVIGAIRDVEVDLAELDIPILCSRLVLIEEAGTK